MTHHTVSGHYQYNELHLAYCDNKIICMDVSVFIYLCGCI